MAVLWPLFLLLHLVSLAIFMLECQSNHVENQDGKIRPPKRWTLGGKVYVEGWRMP